MADALFRKDIRRQKRELTAIRKACKLRNKNPRIPYPPGQGGKVSGGRGKTPFPKALRLL